MRTLPHTAVHPLERLIRDNPSFHTWPDDSPANCSVAPDTLMFIHDQLLPGMNTLETGAGQTTVAFAIAGTHHICITPQREQADRIRDYCDELSVQGDLTFVSKAPMRRFRESRCFPIPWISSLSKGRIAFHSPAWTGITRKAGCAWEASWAWTTTGCPPCASFMTSSAAIRSGNSCK